MAKVEPIYKSDSDVVQAWMIDCPGCKMPHSLNVTGEKPKWDFNGDVNKPTFSPSLLVNGNNHYKNPEVPLCHSFIRDGRIEFLNDCTHDMAGKTVDLPEID